MTLLKIIKNILYLLITFGKFSIFIICKVRVTKTFILYSRRLLTLQSHFTVRGLLIYKTFMENYLKIDYSLLSNKELSLQEVIIISYLRGYQNNGKYCFETQSQMADKFNMSLSVVKRTIKSLQDKGIIFTSNDRKYLIPFNNRKSIILVDEDNPIPTVKGEDKAIINDGNKEIPSRNNKTQEAKDMEEKMEELVERVFKEMYGDRKFTGTQIKAVKKDIKNKLVRERSELMRKKIMGDV